ncbi:hypothetical protein EV426DRAFT_448432 [Tirmania nivea]|nr:hypothetical protein EV426DRAFT_448432 [Tirmania nivea]
MPKTTKPPGSKPVTVTTLQYIELNATVHILSTLCNSMPCRKCFARFRHPSYGHSSTTRTAHSIPGDNMLSVVEKTNHLGLEDELFGHGIGLWKIVLSAQALKDLQTSKSQGNFHHVWAKLQELSTGDWIRKSVARPFKVATGFADFKVRLFIATHSTNNGEDSGILWQVDCAYDLRVRSHSQVVKVWCIGTSDEICYTAEAVARIQHQWSKEHIDRCKQNQLDKALGIKVPALFSEDLPPKDPVEGELDVEKQTSWNLLISNKFYALTNRVFDNIQHGNQYATLPYDSNAIEVTIIKHFETATFILGRSGTGKTTCLLYKLLSRYLACRAAVTEENGHCQILVTRSKELTKKLRMELTALIETQVLNTIHTREPPLEDPEIVNEWNGAEEETENTLFALKYYRFPLVCTFAHFLRLIENTIEQNDRENYAIPVGDPVADFVDFQFFKIVYWPKLACRSGLGLGLNLDPGIVFSEIMGVIKGSASTRNGLKPLSRDEYITRSANLAPSFPTPAARTALFDLYTQYEHRKKQRGDEDTIDRIIKIHLGLKRYGLEQNLRDVIQEIFVDEVQDQRPLELELFLRLVKSPRGVHFAGDSAQCISNDSAFRFANVKALFFDHYAKTKYEQAKPRLFSLSRNYRSCQEILAFSSFVMNLLWKGFPAMVDKLDPEVGDIPREKPIIFIGAGVTDLLVEASYLAHIGTDAADERSNKQVVIVRDNETRHYLQLLLQGKRMVYTILETKGMEYDDVFIFNFFQSSPCSEEMRTLEELLPDQIHDSYAAKNMVMCSELKNLYVAVTRACNRLWMLESSTSSAIDLLANLPKQVIEIKYLNQFESLSQCANTLRPSTATTPEDWIRSGHQCMENGLYDRAIQCFENAGDLRNKTLAQAYLSRQSGLQQRENGDTESFRKSFNEAARLFKELAIFRECAGCFEGLGKYAKAARLWSSNIGDHIRAARLYEKAGCIEDAASEYCQAGHFKQGLRLLYEKKLYEKLILGLEGHLEEIDVDERKEWAMKCNQYVRQPGTKQANQMREKAFELFISNEEKMEYLEMHAHFIELLDFAASRGEFPSTIWFLVLKGHLRKILQLSLQNNGKWKWPANRDSFLEQVYRAIKTETLFKALSTGKEVPETLFTIEKEFLTAPWVKRWHTQINSCSDILANCTLPTKIPLDQDTKELVSVLILAKTEYFTQRATSLSQFRWMLELLVNYVEIFLQPLKLEGSSFSETTLSCLGLIHQSWGSATKYCCSSWSILRQRQGVTGKEFSPGILLEVHKCLSSLVLIASGKFLTKAAKTPILRVTPSICLECVSQGTWSRMRLCYRHPVMNQEVYRNQFKERVRWWQQRLAFKDICLCHKILSPDSNSLLVVEDDLSSQLQFFFLINLLSFKIRRS